MSGNRIFYVTASMHPKQSFCLQTKTISAKEAYIWHFRFGHLNYKALNTLSCKEMVVGLPTLEHPQKTCLTCLIRKQTWRSFPNKNSWKASRQLQLVHSDICGPIQPTSNSSKRYFLSFIDDFARKTWVYFLHEKSEALAVFKKFKARVEKETGTSITCLRTDRGGEFLSREFEVFCQTQGIRRQLTTSYTPKQNGVAERKNRTIMNVVRSMLNEK